MGGKLPPKPPLSNHSAINIPQLDPPLESGQFTSGVFAETLALEGIAALIDSIGETYDSALADTKIDLFNDSAIRDDSPFRDGSLRRREDVEWVTMAWVDWYNQHRLHARIGYVSPNQFAVAYYDDTTTASPPVMSHTLERQNTAGDSRRSGTRHAERDAVSSDTTFGMVAVSLPNEEGGGIKLRPFRVLLACSRRLRRSVRATASQEAIFR